jgi:hypothetical protein
LEKPHYMKVPTDCKPHKESPHLQNTETIHPHKEEDKSQNPTPKCTWRVKYNRIKEVQIAKKKRFQNNNNNNPQLGSEGENTSKPKKSSNFRRGRKKGRPRKQTSFACMELLFSLNNQSRHSRAPKKNTHTYAKEHLPCTVVSRCCCCDGFPLRIFATTTTTTTK